MKKFFLISAVLSLLSSCSSNLDVQESSEAIEQSSNLENVRLSELRLAESFVVGNASRKLWDTSTTEE